MNLKKLDRLALLSCAQAKPSTPTEGLRIVLDLLPLDLFLCQEATLAFYRAGKTVELDWSGLGKNKRFSISHRKYWSQTMAELGLTDSESDRLRCKSWTTDFPCVKQSFRDPDKKVALKGHQVFTDGSKTKKGTGSGLVSYYDGQVMRRESIRLNNSATVFQAEVLAIQRAAEYVSRNWGLHHGKFLKIYSDPKPQLEP